MTGVWFVGLVYGAHLLFHIFGLAGIIWGLAHSNQVHGRKWWKVGLAILWVFISIFAGVDALNDLSSVCHH